MKLFRLNVAMLIIFLIVMTVGACRSNQPIGVFLTPSPEVGNLSIGNSQDQVSVATVIGNSENKDPVLIVSRPIDVEVKKAVKSKGNRVAHLNDGVKLTYDPLVLFEENSTELKQSSSESLTRLAAVLNKHPKSIVVIEGHTDNVGFPQHNQILSDNRAKAVAIFLESKNVGDDRITWKGYGDTQPLFSNKTSQGRKRNRRVEIVIIDKK